MLLATLCEKCGDIFETFRGGNGMRNRDKYLITVCRTCSGTHRILSNHIEKLQEGKNEVYVDTDYDRSVNDALNSKLHNPYY